MFYPANSGNPAHFDLHWLPIFAQPADMLMAIFVTQDGSHSIFSEQYGVSYHSKYGAITESAHVFINAGLRYKAVVQPEIAILEVGFGTGLNAFLSWLEAERRNLVLRYYSIEAYPIPMEDLEDFNYTEKLNIPNRQADFCRLHQCAWNRSAKLSAHFRLYKKQIRLEAFRTNQRFDLIYFDAFAPQAQPELWTERILALMYKSLKPEGALVTYCAQGNFKRTLKKVGFEVECLEGPPGKREMTRASKVGGQD
jgi:tRNA U34 5-methylaminomethyl-2-thiouridine-forming methyltransferase MnmC